MVEAPNVFLEWTSKGICNTPQLMLCAALHTAGSDKSWKMLPRNNERFRKYSLQGKFKGIEFT